MAFEPPPKRCSRSRIGTENCCWALAFVITIVTALAPVLAMRQDVVAAQHVQPSLTLPPPHAHADVGGGIQRSRLDHDPPAVITTGELRHRIDEYFVPVNLIELFAAYDACTPSETRALEHLNVVCVGDYRKVNEYVATLGLPRLGVIDTARATFSYSSYEASDDTLFNDVEGCATTIDRVYRDTGTTLIVLEEPCDAADKPFPGAWEAGRTRFSAVHIMDYQRGIEDSQGVRLYPTLTIEGFESRDAIEALMRYFGLQFKPLGPVME